MKSRPLRPSDIPILKSIADKSGFPYPDLSHPHIEAVEVVTDDEGEIIGACAAKRLVELYLFIIQDHSPAVKMDAIKLLHRSMATSLRAILYNEANVSIPPPLEKQFGRRLERTFGWAKSRWQNWFIRF